MKMARADFAILTMEEYQERVIAEKVALDEKIVNLSGFVRSGMDLACVPIAEQCRLISQLTIMRAYSSVLEDRIACWS